MSKKLRKEPIYIAPKILGWLDENDRPIILDEKVKRYLNATNIDDKIIVYKRQVEEWFLKPSTALLKKSNSGFIVLMTCFSYLEGVEQYRTGRTSRSNSSQFFIKAIERIYPSKYNDGELNDLYAEARCGLFHNGMVKGKVIINNSFLEPLEFCPSLSLIKINPQIFLEDIQNDFKTYIKSLKEDAEYRTNFNRMYSNI